jgi:hypothetical protein
METVHQHSLYVECATVVPVCHTRFVSHTRLHTTLHHIILYTAVRHPHQTCPQFNVYISALQTSYLFFVLNQRNPWGFHHELVAKLGLFVYCKVSRVVGIKTGYGQDGPGIESRWGHDFPDTSRPTLGLTQPPIQWVPGHSRGVKRPGRGTDHPPNLAPSILNEGITMCLEIN